MIAGGQNRPGKNNNWQGVGGLAERPWNRWDPRRPDCPTCAAISRRTGKRCRAAPVKGRTVCQNHGGFAGRGLRRMPKTERALRNQEIHAARKWARQECAADHACGGGLGTRGASITPRGSPPRAPGRFLLALDKYTRPSYVGSMARDTPDVWV